MSAFTRLSAALWYWEPWVSLPLPARMLWLGLYTSAAAKRAIPGLWHGGIHNMAEAASMQADDVVTALDQLLKADMVEYDAKLKVLRLCKLPDAGEYPSNGKVIRSWWTRFRTVPECPIRDAHVATIRWLLETGSSRAGKEISADHQRAWTETFSAVQIPSPRRRGVRQLSDSDTSTSVQPSLFGQPQGQGNGIGYPQTPKPSHGRGDPVDNLCDSDFVNEIDISDTVSDTVSDTNRIPDPGSRIPELSSSFPERGLGGGHDSGKPTLRVFNTFSATDVFRVLGVGRWDSSSDLSHQHAVDALVPSWIKAGVRLDDLRKLAEYSLMPTAAGLKLSARYLAGCDIRDEIARASKALDWRDARVEALMHSSALP